MAIVMTGDPFKMLQAEAVSNSNYSQTDIISMQQNLNTFTQAHNIADNFVSTIAETFDYYNGSEVMMVSDKLLQSTSGLLSKDVYKVLDMHTLKTESLVTKSLIVAHPSLTERVNENLIECYEEEIGLLRIDSNRTNYQYNQVMEGVHNNQFEKGGVIVMQEHYHKSDVSTTQLKHNEKLSAVTMYNNLEDVISLGLDFI